MLDQVSQIMAYEEGELDREEVIALFQELLDSGLVWKLQGSYGRTARVLLDQGLIADRGYLGKAFKGESE